MALIKISNLLHPFFSSVDSVVLTCSTDLYLYIFSLQAVEFAMGFGMWAHALSISLLISSECFNGVRAEYAASLGPFGQPRKSQYWVKNSAPPDPTGPHEIIHVDCVKMLFFLHALPIAIHEQEVVETEKSEPSSQHSIRIHIIS